MDPSKPFEALFEQWRAADQAATDAWACLRAPRATRDTRYQDLIAAMRLQLEANELLAELRSELRRERRLIPVI